MRFLGNIVRLQVQAASLKVGEAPRKRYDPAAITPVATLLVEQGGVVGKTDWGEDVIDVHHRDHPATKHRVGSNGISVLFTAHYGAIRRRFGDRLPDGIAGENILVEHGAVLDEADVAPGLIVEGADGRRLTLVSIIVATPCVEFSRFALRFPEEARPDQTVTKAVRFLDSGMRGYYAAPDRSPVELRLGDRVYAVR